MVGEAMFDMGRDWALNPPKSCPKCMKRVKVFYINLDLDQVVMCENVMCDWPFKDINGISIIPGKVQKDTKRKDGGHGVSTRVTKVATEAAIVDTMQALSMGEATFDEVKAGKEKVMVGNKESDKVKVDNKEADEVKVVKNKELNQVKVVKEDLDKIKGVAEERVGEEIRGVSKVEDESFNNAEKMVSEESCDVVKRKKKKQVKKTKQAEYKGFEKVVKAKEPACEEAGLDKEIFNQSNIDCEEFNQVKKDDVTEKKDKCGKEKFDKKFACEEAGLDKEIFNQSKIDFNQVKKDDVTEKKEKRGREKFEKEFARSSHNVGKLMKKVEKTNKKMEKLGRKKEGFVPIVSDGEQWFDATADLVKQSLQERQGGMEIMQGGFASVSVEVKKAEVPAEEADILSKLLAEVASSTSGPNIFQEPAPKGMGMRLPNISPNSTIDELIKSPPLNQQDCSIADEEDSRLAKCMDEFDPEAFLNSIDFI